MNEKPQQAVNLDDVESGLGAYLKHKWWQVLIVAVVALVAGIYAPIIVLIALIFGMAYVRSQYEKNLFGAFATTNHYTFTKKGDAKFQTGLIFGLGHDQKCCDIVSGTYQKWPFELFVYQYTIGSGKNQVTYDRPTMAVAFQTPLPAFALKRHGFLTGLENEGESMRRVGYSQKLDLEGDFDKHFRVYLPPNSQVEVLSILTPDFMQMLIPLDKYELEMTKDGTFYIYCKALITKKAELIQIYKILDSIVVKLGVDVQRQQLVSAASA